MRVEAYSAVNRIYQSGAASSAKKEAVLLHIVINWKFQEQQRIIRQQKRQ